MGPGAARRWERGTRRALDRRPRQQLDHSPLQLLLLGPSHEQRPIPAALVQQSQDTLNALTELRVERAKVEGARAALDADLGLVEYQATLLNSNAEQTMRYFILIVALLLDPAAVLFLLAATHRGRQ